MKEHIWKPVEAVQEMRGEITCIYRNELGEEYTHVTELFGVWGNEYLRACCWSGCSGDWPGCKMTCPLFTDLGNEMLEKQREWEYIGPMDPFSFMLNQTEEIDAHNCYVETFDTLDGTHWEIAVDISRQIMEELDAETEERTDDG